MPTSRVSKRAQLLKKAKVHRCTFKVCLGRDDDVYEDLDELIEDYNESVRVKPDDDDSRADLKASISTLMDLVTVESTLTGHFQREPSMMKWQAFKGEFPPREKPREDPEAPREFEDSDEAWGLNFYAFAEAAVRKYMVDPMDDDEWEAFAPQVNRGDWIRLGSQILALNERGRVAPKLPPGFTATVLPVSA